MKYVVESIKYLLLVAAFSAGGYYLYTQAKPLLESPCTTPIVYSIGEVDSRFGVTKSELEDDVSIATGVWNRALGKTVFTEGEGGMVINLVYSEHQRATELGKDISSEQKTYNLQKAQVETMKKSFNSAKDSVESLQSSYNTKAQAYQNEVEAWNRKGGAPPEEYARLQAQKQQLDATRVKVNTAISNVNTLADDLNTAVAKLNSLAANINTHADTFNQYAGTDYEQGEYKKQNGKESISIYEFSDTKTLQRVLAHEFGHALGLDHVANPDSIMYAYDIGDGLSLTVEDTVELKTACHIK